jgi:hypothetical protein
MQTTQERVVLLLLMPSTSGPVVAEAADVGDR